MSHKAIRRERRRKRTGFYSGKAGGQEGKPEQTLGKH